METSTSELIEALYQNYSPRVSGEAVYNYGDPIYINFGSYDKVEEEDIKFARSFAIRIRKKLGNDAKVKQSSCRVVITPN